MPPKESQRDANLQAELAHMSAERARQLKMDTLEQWAELKTRRAVLDAIFDKWRDLFTRASIQLETIATSGSMMTDVKSIPAGADVDAALVEYKQTGERLVKLKQQLMDLGLRVE